MIRRRAGEDAHELAGKSSALAFTPSASPRLSAVLLSGHFWAVLPRVFLREPSEERGVRHQLGAWTDGRVVVDLRALPATCPGMSETVDMKWLCCAMRWHSGQAVVTTVFRSGHQEKSANSREQAMHWKVWMDRPCCSVRRKGLDGGLHFGGVEPPTFRFSVACPPHEMGRTGGKDMSLRVPLLQGAWARS